MDKVIYECPDDMSPAIMEEFGFEELDDINQNDLSEENKIGKEKEEGEVSTETENADIIHRVIHENKAETNWDTLDKAIKECPDITHPAMMEDCGNEELDGRNTNEIKEGLNIYIYIYDKRVKNQ